MGPTTDGTGPRVTIKAKTMTELNRIKELKRASGYLIIFPFVLSRSVYAPLGESSIDFIFEFQ